MEQENKKIRDKNRKERNEAVRNLVSYVRYIKYLRLLLWPLVVLFKTVS